MIDYSLWEVMLNGDSPTPTRVIDGVVQAVAPIIVKQRLAKKNELKAKGTLLMALPDKHQLIFNTHKDAKSLMKAIEKRTPSIGFMRPFGCPVTILNPLDPFGKFDGKADEGFFVGYYVSTVGKEAKSIQQYVLLPLLFFGSKDSQNIDADAIFEVKEPESDVHVSPCSSDKTKKHDEKTKREAKVKSPVNLSTDVRNLSEEFEDFSSNSTNGVNAASTPVTAVGINSTNNTNSFIVAGPSNNAVSPTFEIGGKSSFVDLS
nr:ribonuclease H-like domain-containing protein [Tanacetum cinerariifolium]